MKNAKEQEYIKRETERLLGYLEILEATRGSICSYREELINQYSWDVDNDVRINILNQIDIILVSHVSNLYFNIKFVVNHSLQDDLFKLTDFKQATQQFVNYTTYNKNALIYNLTAVIERFLRIIAREIDTGIDMSIQFYKIKNKVFEYIGIAKDGNEWAALSLLSSIRNTIHNNGIYINKNDQTFSYRDVSYAFKNNHVQNFADYENLNNILADTLILIRMINQNQLMLSKDSLVDHYQRQ